MYKFNFFQKFTIAIPLNRFWFVLFVSILFFSLDTVQPQSLERVDLSGYAQGTTWHITYYQKNKVVSTTQIDSVLCVIDSSLSIYKPYSKIIEFNNSKEGIAIDFHFKKVIQKSLDTYHQTQGFFDITVLPVIEAWGFGVSAHHKASDPVVVDSLLKCVSSNYLWLQGNFLGKSKPCVKIDVNGIAQGYSVDVLADFLARRKIRNYLIELGGEIIVKGRKQPGDEPFIIGIESPAKTGELTIRKMLELDSGAITTSGNYRKYYESKAGKISHIINPLTGYPAKNELISTTVYAKDAITADAYDNALMVMGLKKALQFIEARKDISAYFIYQKSDGHIADTASSKFYRLIKN